MHTNEAYFSRVCCWNLINTLKQLFAARIQKSKKIEEHELIAFFFCICAVESTGFIFYLRGGPPATTDITRIVFCSCVFG